MSRVNDPSRRRFFATTGFPILGGALAVGLAVSLLLLWSSRQTDRVAIDRQEQLVALVVSQMQTKLAHDQESATVWDDAVNQLKPTVSLEWVDLNLGSWMGTYFGHDGAYVLDSQDHPVYAFTDKAVADPASAYGRIASSVEPLVARLRARLRAADTSGVTDQILSPGVADLQVVDGHPAVVSVKPIVSDSGNIVQEPGSEFLHIAVRHLDGSFAQSLANQYLFEGLRFSWDSLHKSSEATHVLHSSSGKTLGHFIWKPYRPGSAVLAMIAPWLAALLLAVLGVITMLVRRLRRRSIRLRLSEEKIRHLALHDPLTGLPNRVMFNDKLATLLRDLPQNGHQAAILYLDLDRFKQVNDTLGHPAGDQLIREFAARLRHQTREADTVSRVGGDEFTIIVPHAGGPDEIGVLCERIVDSIRQPFHLLGSQIFIGVSIGVALAPGDGVDAMELTRKADIALYHAKARGRSRYAVFGTDMDAILQSRRSMEQDLRAALDVDDQITVHYQPLFSASEFGLITGVEALLRWRHPLNGWVSPEVFIPLAEEAGLIEKLGERVLREACTTASPWPIGTIAVNVSAIELRNPTYAMRVANLLMSLGVSPTRLELELTESALTDNSGYSEQNLRSLRELGVRVALDDFGTGFSSLGRLQSLQVDRIKIDRSFVHGFGRSNGDEAIVQAIVELAKATGLKTTAEGVETNAQRNYLTQLGCDELQGFLLSRPIAQAEIEALLGVSSVAPSKYKPQSAA